MDKQDVSKDVEATVSWQGFENFVQKLMQVKPEEIKEAEKREKGEGGKAGKVA